MSPIEASKNAPETLPQALLCDADPERRARCQGALGEAGYAVRLCGDAVEALALLREGRPAVHRGASRSASALCLVHERFPEALLGAVHGLSGRLRRELCVGLIGADLRTLDPMLAFCLSVDFVVAERDLAQLRSVVHKALGDHRAMYEVFGAVLRGPKPTRRNSDA